MARRVDSERILGGAHGAALLHDLSGSGDRGVLHTVGKGRLLPGNTDDSLVLHWVVCCGPARSLASRDYHFWNPCDPVGQVWTHDSQSLDRGPGEYLHRVQNHSMGLPNYSPSPNYWSSVGRAKR